MGIEVFTKFDLLYFLVAFVVGSYIIISRRLSDVIFENYKWIDYNIHQSRVSKWRKINIAVHLVLLVLLPTVAYHIDGAVKYYAKYYLDNGQQLEVKVTKEEYLHLKSVIEEYENNLVNNSEK